MSLFGRISNDESGPIVPFGERRGTVGSDHGPLGRLKVERSSLEPTDLRSRAGRVVRLIFALCMCAFWNGIVSVFVSIAVAGHLNGKPDWFMTLFMIPFVAIGLGLMAWVIHSFFSLFNPDAILNVSRTALAPGDEVTIAWHFSRRPARIRRFALTLEADERATYTVGTSTTTDTDRLHEIDVFQSSNPSAFERGEVTIQIPVGVMHSFEASNNKVVWRIRAHGEIGFWPDINDEHDLVIAPRPVLENVTP